MKAPSPSVRETNSAQSNPDAATWLSGPWRFWPVLSGLLAAPVDAASLALFRIGFGLVLTWEAARYLWPNGESGSWVLQHYVTPGWTFPYHGFEWVRPFPEPWLTVTFVAWAVAGLLLAAGLFYRFAAIAAFVLTTYVFLLDAAHYLNHFYLMCLVAFLMMWLPAARLWSLDSARGAVRPPSDSPRDCVPFWTVFLLRAQFFILYFYGGLAKIDPNWLSGEALFPPATRAYGWLEPLLGGEGMAALKLWFDVPQLALFLAISGMLYDLAIPFLLIWRRTRFLALALTGFFHLFNSQAFSIGVFPVLAFSSTLIFCEPDWPRRLAAFCARPRIPAPHWAWFTAGLLAVPGVGALLGWRAAHAAARCSPGSRRLPRLTATLLAIWIVGHALVPLRHFAIPGDAAWTEEGHRFSWRMMLRGKAGSLRLAIFDPALAVTSAEGATAVNWEEYTRLFPRVMYEEVDATNVNWYALPPLVVVYEPLLGERIVLNHLSHEVAGSTEARAQLLQDWQAAYGRAPALNFSVPLTEALANLEREVTNQAEPLEPEAAQLFADTLADAKRLVYQKKGTIYEAESIAVDLNRACDFLLRFREVSDAARRNLARVHPFVLQGAAHRGTPFQIVHDAALLDSGSPDRPLLDRAAWKFSELVYADLTRMNRQGWQNLPQVVITQPEGQPRFEWNMHHDLTYRQLSQVQQLPFMAHQYVQRVAQFWEGKFGRRPAVYAEISQVRFNRRPLQSILDPTVDLAAASLRLFGHNDWILPLDQDRPVQTTELAGEPQGDGTGAAYDDDSRATTLRYPSGLKHSEEHLEFRAGQRISVAQAWRANGHLMMRAEYLNGRQHGVAQRWHSNGQLALEAHYEHGQRHGRSTIWYPNGQKSWEGEFRRGERQGLATGWYADGRVAEQAEFTDGKLVRRLPAPAREPLAERNEPGATQR